jgi:DNA-binding winged helix-turn-helix (wHTH) protein/TolB-like protein/Tfp pilus assembly protein PilF
MALATKRLFRFGPFRLDIDRRLLLRAQEAIPLRPRVFDTLVVLAERAGDVVSKEELLDVVWPDTVVEENNLSQNILALRRALAAHGSTDIRIETVPRRGYRLIAQIEQELASPMSTFAAPRPDPRLVPEAKQEQMLSVSAAASRVARTPGRSARWLALTLLALGLLVAGAFWLVRSGAPPARLARIRSVAVLPFRPIVLPTDDLFLSLALADSVITRLSRISRLAVRPTGSIRELGVRPPEPVAAGKALRVDAVLDGQIQEVGDRVRVTVQLVGISEGTPLWSGRYDAPRATLFELEDSIADGVAGALASGAASGSGVVARRAPAPEAYEAYLRGRYYWNKRTDETNRKSQALFRQAIDADPTFAPAWVGLADALNFVGHAPEAKRAAERALGLDPGLAEAHTALGNVALFYDFDVSAAEDRFRRAIALNPSYATAHQWRAYSLAAQRRFNEALSEIREARSIDPLSLSILTDVGDILFYAGHYDDAEQETRRALEMDEHFVQAHIVLGEVLLAKNDIPGALRELEGVGSPGLAIALVCAGRASEARAIAAELPKSDRFDVIRAAVLLALGEPTQALDELDRAYRGHAGELIMVGVHPRFAPLHGDPRFTDLLRRLRLFAPAA